MDTAREVFAWAFWHYRAATGTVSECARMAGYSHGLLSDIEHGRKVPSLDVARDLDQALGARGVIINTVRILREADRKADREGSSVDVEQVDATDATEAGEVERRELLQHALKVTGGAGLVGTFGHLDTVRATLDDVLGRSVEEWQEIAEEYAYDVLTTPPSEMLHELATDTLAVRRLLDCSIPNGRHSELYRVAARLSGLVARSFRSLAENARARSWWRTATAAADQSGDLELRVWVRGHRTVSALYEGVPYPRVTQLADRALTLAETGDATGAGVTEALAGKAQALARMGRPDAADTVETLADAFDRLPARTAGDRVTVNGWSESALQFVRSYVYTHTGDARATEAQDAALALYPPHVYGDPANVNLHRATWLVRTGDPTEGLRYATQTVVALPRQCRTQSIMKSAGDVERALPLGVEATPEAAEYRELLALPASAE